MPADWDMRNLNGKPKKVAETFILRNSKSPNKTVNYYNEDEYIIKTENYNSFQDWGDSSVISEVIYYLNPNSHTKVGYMFRDGQSDTIKMLTTIYHNNNLITEEIIDKQNPYHTKITKELYDDFREKSITLNVKNTEESKTIYNSSIKYTYEGDRIKDIIITVKDHKNSIKTTYSKNMKLDNKGNLIHLEHIIENGSIIDWTYKASYEY